MSNPSLTAGTILAIAATVFAALALSVVPMGAGHGAAVWPKLTVIIVFFWLVHRPAGMPILAVLTIGVVCDLIGGGIVGAGALPLLIGSMVVRPFAATLSLSPFPMRWLIFTGFAAFTFLGEWALTGLAHLMMPPASAPLAQFFVTVFAYLIISVLFRRVFRIGRS